MAQEHAGMQQQGLLLKLSKPIFWSCRSPIQSETDIGLLSIRIFWGRGQSDVFECEIGFNGKP